MRASLMMAVAVAALASSCTERDPGWNFTPLGPEVPVEDVVANLSAAFDTATIERQREEAPVHSAGVRLGAPGGVTGGVRQAIVAPPPSRLRFRTEAPAGAVLRFSIGLQHRHTDAPEVTPQSGSPTRFVVEIDGEARYARRVEPADRGWRSGRVDLALHEPREIEIVLRTSGTAAATGGRPAWSDVRIVREGTATRQPRDAGPSVLLLLVDTLRADRLGCYGAVPSPSPTLDRLASDGMLFEQAIAQAPWTLPAVATLFTGLHPRSHGLTGTGDDDTTSGRSEASYLSDRLPTIASWIRSQGVSTFAISTNPLVSRRTNLARGFETFIGFGPRGESSWQRARRVNEVFADWLHANREQRFFAVLHYMDMHAPYDPPARYRPPPPTGMPGAILAGNLTALERAMDETGAPPDGAEMAYLRQLYDAQLAYWDDQLAWLLVRIDQLGLTDTTRIIVTSDHGEGFLDHGRLGHGGDLHDELIRMPLIIAGPGIEPGHIGDQAQGIDLFPTVARLLGAAPPVDLPGQDLLGRRAARPAVSETRWGAGPAGQRIALLSVRTPRWKLVHAPRLDRFSLYDLTKDPGEQRDLYGTEPAALELSRALDTWTANVPPAPEVIASDPGLHDKLRALGYVE